MLLNSYLTGNPYSLMPLASGSQWFNRLRILSGEMSLADVFWRSPMSGECNFNLSSCSSLWTAEDSPAWSPCTTPVALVLGYFFNEKGTKLWLFTFRVWHFLMHHAVHAELSPCDCPLDIRCLVYGSILWSAIRPNHNDTTSVLRCPFYTYAAWSRQNIWVFLF